jgi:predicted nucleotide-binding protein (sugar kinase/HSP70/actin superfamily)
LLVGIPRALLYYKYFPMWAVFLKKLGADLVVSEETNQRVILQGASRVVSDTCLPVKVFVGHVLALVGKCDSVLIPVVRSTEKKVLNCARFLGLPDMTKAVVPEAPPIFEIEFDVNRGRHFLYRQIYTLGSHFTRNPLKIRQAAHHAWTTYGLHRRMMPQYHLTRVEAIMMQDTMLNSMTEPVSKMKGTLLTIGLVGHPYVLHDKQISQNLIEKLRSYSIEVLTPEMVPRIPAKTNINAEFTGLASRYWESEEDMIDAGNFYIDSKVDGIIGMMSFGCGPDSLMMHLVQRQAQNADIPFMNLTVEEHTAEAGIVTRVEAFVDMLHRRNKKAG